MTTTDPWAAMTAELGQLRAQVEQGKTAADHLIEGLHDLVAERDSLRQQLETAQADLRTAQAAYLADNGVWLAERDRLRSQLDVCTERWRRLDVDLQGCRYVLGAADVDTATQAARRLMGRITELEEHAARVTELEAAKP